MMTPEQKKSFVNFVFSEIEDPDVLHFLETGEFLSEDKDDPSCPALTAALRPLCQTINDSSGSIPVYAELDYDLMHFLGIRLWIGDSTEFISWEDFYGYVKSRNIDFSEDADFNL